MRESSSFDWLLCKSLILIMGIPIHPLTHSEVLKLFISSHLSKRLLPPRTHQQGGVNCLDAVSRSMNLSTRISC